FRYRRFETHGSQVPLGAMLSRARTATGNPEPAPRKHAASPRGSCFRGAGSRCAVIYQEPRKHGTLLLAVPVTRGKLVVGAGQGPRELWRAGLICGWWGCRRWRPDRRWGGRPLRRPMWVCGRPQRLRVAVIRKVGIPRPDLFASGGSGATAVV